MNAFGIDLLKHQLQLERGNTTLAALSAANTLAILHTLSDPAVQKQIERRLASPEKVLPIIPNIKSRQPDGKSFYKQPEYAWAFRSADSIFCGSPHLLQEKVKPYKKSMVYVKTDFSSPHESYRFINTWVNSHTDFDIKNFLEGVHIPTEADRIIINAVSLKGSWSYPFNPKKTHLRNFHADGQIIQIPMMIQDRVSIACHLEKSGLSVIALPYGAPGAPPDEVMELVLMVIMPGNDTNLYDFIKNLTTDQIRSIIPRRIIEAKLEFPRFKSLGKTISLKPLFQSMGITGIFSSDAMQSTQEDDLSSPQIDDIFHQSFLSITETGTEPTSSLPDDQSVGGRGEFCMESELPTIQINRPFMWFIYDMKNRCIVFIGAQFTPNPS